MRKITVDGIGYYLSCMILFNTIYSVKMVVDGLFLPDNINWGSWTYYVDLVTFAICILLAFAGMVFTATIINQDDSIRSESTLGRKVIISELSDLTGENYFTNYSLLVLTGLSLPTNQGILTTALYFLVFFTLGTVYIKKNLIYINPALTISNFSIYRCVNKVDRQSYVFVIKDATLEDGDTVNYQNISSRIIRLNGVNAIKKKVNL